MNRITKAFALVVALLCALAVALPRPALAAANPWTVTLGADLNAEQRATVLKFFGLTEADLASRNVITVTNADERRYLEGQLPSEVIGDKTWSCSYIQQLDRGGIRVETANLTYVTKNTLYTTRGAIERKLREGAVFSFGIVDQHIALIDGLSADGTMCHVVDSAPSATFRYLDGVSPSVLDPETGAYLPAEKPTDLPGVCYCLQTHDYDGAEYWLPLAYAARRGLRLIQPKGE